jgi:hypothetical protein
MVEGETDEGVGAMDAGAMDEVVVAGGVAVEMVGAEAMVWTMAGTIGGGAIEWINGMAVAWAVVWATAWEAAWVAEWEA